MRRGEKVFKSFVLILFSFRLLPSSFTVSFFNLRPDRLDPTGTQTGKPNETWKTKSHKEFSYGRFILRVLRWQLDYFR